MECMRDLQHLAEDPRLSTRFSIGDYSIWGGRDSLVNELNQMLSWYAPQQGDWGVSPTGNELCRT